jgi:hypothetical protein
MESVTDLTIEQALEIRKQWLLSQQEQTEEEQ